MHKEFCRLLVRTFITEDTYQGQVDNPLSLNRYAYTHNNPIRYTDPSGHDPGGAVVTDKYITGQDGIVYTRDGKIAWDYYADWYASDAEGMTSAMRGQGALQTAIVAKTAFDYASNSPLPPIVAGGVGGKGKTSTPAKGTAKVTETPASPALKGDPYHPDSVANRVKPPYKANPAHDKGSPYYNPKKTPEPLDSVDVYNNSVRGGMGTWYGVNKDGKIYQFFSDNAGGVHFAGEITKDKLTKDVRQQLGLK